MAADASRVRRVVRVPVKRRGGVVAALAVWALAAALLSAPSAVAQTQGSGGGGGFPDVPDDAFYAGSVGSLAGDGVFSGTECEEGLCPGESIDRKTIAVWLVRVLDGSDPGPVADSGFSDIDAAGFHAPFVKRLSELGVTTGCGDGTRFCGDRAVTRAQVAVFLSRAFDLADGPDPGFADVPSDVWFAADVARLAAAGVTGGCGDGTRFCPGRDTTRGQMAVFLARADGRVALPERLAEPLAPAALARGAAYERPPGLQVARSEVSPDRSRVVYHGRVEQDEAEGTSVWGEYFGPLYVAGADGTGLKRVSDRAFFRSICFATCSETYYVVWSPDSRYFTYATDDKSGEAAVYLAPASGVGSVKLVDIPSRHVYGDRAPVRAGVVLHDLEILWSPGGGHVAYSGLDGEDNRRLFVASAATATPVELAGDVRSWQWSPDGRHIAYSVWEGDWDQGLFVASADGGEIVQLEHYAYQERWSWSADGWHIAYMAYAAGEIGGDSWLSVASADGVETVRSPQGAWVRAYAWSPDGRHIAFNTFEDLDPNLRMYVASADGAKPVRLVAENVYIESWSPDSRHIAYTKLDDGNWQLFMASADGTDPVEVADDHTDAAWSPDGRHIAYTTRDEDGIASLFVASTEGGAAARLATAAGLALLPADAWSPDSRRIAYTTRDGEGNTRLFAASADGARNSRVADRLYPGGDEVAAVWAPEGSRIAFLEPPAEITGSAYEVSLVAVTIADLERAVVEVFDVDVCEFDPPTYIQEGENTIVLTYATYVDGHALRRWTTSGIEVDDIRVLCVQ